MLIECRNELEAKRYKESSFGMWTIDLAVVTMTHSKNVRYLPGFCLSFLKYEESSESSLTNLKYLNM